MKKIGLIVYLTSFIFTVGFGQNFSLKTEGKNNISIKENTYAKLRVIQELNDFRSMVVKTDQGNFIELGVEGYNFNNAIGSPKLPVKSQLIEIPMGATVKVVLKTVTSTEYSLKELGLNYPIVPLQPPLSKNATSIPPLVIDKQAYEKNQFSQSDVVTVDILGTMRGIRVARLNIAPVQYNPVTNRIKVYEFVDFQVIFENADLTTTLTEKKKNDNPYFGGVNNMLANYKPLKSSAKDTITKYPVKYVIVSPPAFEPLLQPFIQWKRKKGFTVVEAYTNNPAVGTTTTSIKNYLQGLYQAGTASDPAPTFILLVGDITQIPSFMGTAGGHYSDMYYAEYTGDVLPEVFIGRFSAENENQLIPQIDKTLEYEKYQMPDPSFLDQVDMIAGVDPNFGPIHANGQINYGTDNYFNAAHGLISHTYLYPQSGSSAAEIIQDVSNGVGFANYTAHGSSDGWANPAFGVADVATLQNAHKYPLMVGNCCLTNKFDDPVCFGEALLRASNKGAVGYIGGTNVTYWDEDFYWGVGVRSISANPTWSASEQRGAYDVTFHDHGEPFSQWYVTNAEMVYAGNMAVTIGVPNSTTYYWEVYMLMGDPSTMTYFGVPPAMNVSYNNLMPLAVTNFTVNTEPYTYVAISQAGVLHGAALADSTGVANVSLDPITTPGYAYIVITGQNWQPVIDSVVVASPSGPYVLMNSYQANEITGNGNGQIDYGETISLDMTLKNWGLTQANNVTCTISSTDCYVNITDNTQGFGDIAAGATGTQNNAFAFTVSNSVPDQHKVLFVANVSDGSGNNWGFNFKLTMNAPELAAGTMVINDNATGNGNGRLDPGETVDLIISGFNNGHADAINTVGSAILNSPLVTLNNSTSPMNTITTGSSGLAIFSITVSPTAQTGDNFSLNFSFASGAYNASKTFGLSVGMLSEDWESNSFTHYNWTNTGNAPWIITTENPYEGLYCSKSGTIGNNQHSDLYIHGNVLMEDSISFYRRVSSEADYDFLQFYVDGTKLDEWSGEAAWGREAYKITTGEHTFKWVYKKDGSETGGSDAAWIDFVVFPPTSGLTVGIENTEPEAFNYQIFPNPSSSQSQFVIYLDKACKLNMTLYNAMGQQVKTLVNEQTVSSGMHTYNITTSDLSKGVYYCRVNKDNTSSVIKLIVQ